MLRYLQIIGRKMQVSEHGTIIQLTSHPIHFVLGGINVNQFLEATQEGRERFDFVVIKPQFCQVSQAANYFRLKLRRQFFLILSFKKNSEKIFKALYTTTTTTTNEVISVSIPVSLCYSDTLCPFWVIEDFFITYKILFFKYYERS